MARGAGVLALCALALSASLLSPAGADSRSRPPHLKALQATAEWGQLARVWHALLDCSRRQTARSDELEALALSVESARRGLKELAGGESGGPPLIPKEIAQELDAMVRERGQYLQDRFLARPGGEVRLDQLEASVEASHWVVEMQLAVLRDAIRGAALREQEPDPRLAPAAMANLQYEFTFLHHYRQFQAGLLSRRADLVRREQAGEAVDWPGFESECNRKRSALCDAYHRRSLPSVGIVQAAMPYLFALTEEEPSPAAPPDTMSGRGI